jgi:hypothetical protein
MALNSSGPISLGGTTTGQSIEVELGGTGLTMISLNDTTVRTLAGVASGQITMPTNFWGKSNASYWIGAITGPRNLNGYFISIDSSYNIYGVSATSGTTNPRSAHLVKFSPTGSTIWSKLYQGSGTNGACAPIGPIELNPNGYYNFTGLTNVTGTTNLSGMISLDSNGNIIQSRNGNDTGGCNGFVTFANGNILSSRSGGATVYNSSYGAIASWSLTNANFTYAGLDSAGNAILIGAQGATRRSLLCASISPTGTLNYFTITPANGTTLTAGANNLNMNSSGTIAIGWGTVQGMLACSLFNTSNGSFIRTSNIIISGFGYLVASGPCGVAFDSSGNYYGLVQGSTGNNYLILFKWNSSGTLIWQRNITPSASFALSVSNTTSSYRGRLAVDNSGNLYVSIYVLDTTTFVTRQYIMKLPSDGSKLGTYGPINEVTFTYSVGTQTDGGSSSYTASPYTGYGSTVLTNSANTITVTNGSEVMTQTTI